MLTRRNIREKVLQACFAQIVSEELIADVYTNLLEKTYKEVKNQKDVADSDEDAKFLTELFFGTLKNTKDYQDLIVGKLDNWDYSRVAVIDKVILLLAIHELIAFPEIPIKVTINEYLDIARDYSTPKSSQFINGIIDKINNDLSASGKIKKWGRGLL